MLQPGNSQLEMGYTESEFSKVLHGDLTGDSSPYICRDITQSQWIIIQNEADLEVDIFVKQMPPRVLGLLNLPVLQVTFKVLSGDEQNEQAFFKKFFKYFHKGGG